MKQTNFIVSKILIAVCVVFGCLTFSVANAGYTYSGTGSADATNKYSYSENAGWLNFGTTEGGFNISSTKLTGYIWAENVGWISLSCSNDNSCATVDYGVANDGAGNLSGYAYGENIGWINFNPDNGGVTVSGEGNFSGYAWSENIGWISFNCADENSCATVDYYLKADWGYTYTNGGGTGVGPIFYFYCGDGVKNGSEECDGLSGVGTHQSCSVGCVLISEPYCGDGIKNGSEECDGGSITCVAQSGYNGTKSCLANCSGYNTCSSAQSCGDSVCNGTETCSTCAGDCGSCPKHKECNNFACVFVDGVGDDTCQTDNNCAIFHYACIDQKCVSVAGEGNNQCQTDENCNVFHKECSNQQCVDVLGLGINQCSNNSQCVTPKHNKCSQERCIVVDGSGSDECLANSDCTIPTHSECDEYQRCVQVNGLAPNQCGQNSDCVKIYNICVGKTCVQFNGVGASNCSQNSDCQNNNQPVGGGTNIEIHNICQEEKCVAVSGPGQDQCNSDANCTEFISKTIINIAKTVDDTTKQVIQSLPAPVKLLAEQARKVLQSSESAVIVKTVTGVGILTVAITAIMSAMTSLVTAPIFELITIPLRLFSLLLTALGIRKKTVPWGVVYDSVTKRPLDPAYIVLKNTQGKEIYSATTDLDGRYGFSVPPGIYKIEARKTNYVFPSQILAGKNQDELHNDLYFGENIEVVAGGQVIMKNIPLDPIKFDWNEFAKRDKNLLKFYSKWDIALRKVYDWFFVVGFVVAFIAFIFAPYPYNTIIALLYLVFLVLRIVGLKPKAYGYITDKKTGEPLSFAIIRVLMSGTRARVTSKSADKYGRYYCLVPPGEYIVEIEKKNRNGSYSLFYTSSVINTGHRGIIKDRFII